MERIPAQRGDAFGYDDRYEARTAAEHPRAERIDRFGECDILDRSIVVEYIFTERSDRFGEDDLGEGGALLESIVTDSGKPFGQGHRSTRILIEGICRQFRRFAERDHDVARKVSKTICGDLVGGKRHFGQRRAVQCVCPEFCGFRHHILTLQTLRRTHDDAACRNERILLREIIFVPFRNGHGNLVEGVVADRRYGSRKLHLRNACIEEGIRTDRQQPFGQDKFGKRPCAVECAAADLRERCGEFEHSQLRAAVEDIAADLNKFLRKQNCRQRRTSVKCIVGQCLQPGRQKRLSLAAVDDSLVARTRLRPNGLQRRAVIEHIRRQLCQRIGKNYRFKSGTAVKNVSRRSCRGIFV